jgi:hypothetical protein
LDAGVVADGIATRAMIPRDDQGYRRARKAERSTKWRTPSSNSTIAMFIEPTASIRSGRPARSRKLRRLRQTWS